MAIRHEIQILSYMAERLGAQVIRGPVRYPGRRGGVDVGEVNIEEPLCGLKDQEVLIIVAPLNPAQEISTVCGSCGMPYERGECPACKTKSEETKRAAEEGLLFDEEFSGLLSQG